MNTDSKQSHHIAEIRRLNDQLRTTFVGGAIVITPGIEMLTLGRRSALMSAVQNFNAFSAGDDPYGEHDFGAIDLTGEKFFFKIDYYDLAMDGGSPDPADPRRTRRVMTIMCAAEY
jgi:Protein of unknown function (DUF3768)